MLTCNNNLSSAHITALLQSITCENGNAHPFDNKTGIQPACNASKKRYEPSRRPRGTKQNVEF